MTAWRRRRASCRRSGRCPGRRSASASSPTRRDPDTPGPAGAGVVPLGRRQPPARPDRRRRLQAVRLPAALLQAPLRRLGRGVPERPRRDRRRGLRAGDRRRPVHHPGRRPLVRRARGGARRRPEAAGRVPRHRDGQPGAPGGGVRQRAVDRQGADAGRDAQEPDRALLAAHAQPRRGARGRTGQRLRVPRQAVRRRQRPHGAGVLHQPHAGAPDDADTPAAAGRAHLRPDCRHRRHAHLGPRRGAAHRRRHADARPSTDRRSSAQRRRSPA